MRSELRTLGVYLLAGALSVFAAASAEARVQAADTRPNTPARLRVCNALADGRGLQGPEREEYLGDCLLLPVLATPPGVATAAPEEPRTRRQAPERQSPEDAPQRPAPRRAEQNERPSPAPPAETLPDVTPHPPSVAIPAASAGPATAPPSVSSGTRLSALVGAVALFGLSLVMVRIGGPVAAVTTSIALVFSLGVTALAFNVWRTLFNPEFVIAELHAADAVGSLEKMMTGDAGGGEEDPLQQVMRASFKDERTHISGQIDKAVHGLYDYLGGKSADVKLAFEPGTVRETLARHVRAGVAADAPPDASPEEVRQRADETARQIVGELDGMLGTTITLAMLPPEATEPLAALRRARPYVMWTLAGTALLSLQCFLLLWLVGSPRWVGAVALVTGVLLLAAPFALDGAARWALKTFGGEMSTLMPPDVVLKVISHFWGPLRFFALVTLVVGAAAIAVSFLRPYARPAVRGVTQ